MPGKPRDFYDIQKVPENTKKLIWNIKKPASYTKMQLCNTKKTFWNTMKPYWNPKKLPCNTKTLLRIIKKVYGTQGSYSGIRTFMEHQLTFMEHPGAFLEYQEALSQ